MSLFQRNSSFDEHAGGASKQQCKEWQERLDAQEPPDKKINKVAKDDGPSRSDLEHWYRVLDEMMDVGSHQSSAELRDTLGDVRDEIYGFLR